MTGLHSSTQCKKGETRLLSCPFCPTPAPHRGRAGEGKGSPASSCPFSGRLGWPAAVLTLRVEDSCERGHQRRRKCGRRGGRGISWVLTESELPFPVPRGMMSPWEKEPEGKLLSSSGAWDLRRSQGFSCLRTPRGSSVGWEQRRGAKSEKMPNQK